METNLHIPPEIILQSPDILIKSRWTKEEYNNEPVYVCKRCHSLAIMTYNQSNITEYCRDCGSTDIEIMSIEDWLKITNKI